LRNDGMCAYNAVSPNNHIIFRGDYHAAVAEPAILFNDYATSGSESLFHDGFIHIRIFVIMIGDKHSGSHQYILSNGDLVNRSYHRPTPHPAAPANHDSGFRTVWNDGDVQPHVAM